MKIPLSRPDITEADIEEVVAVLRSTQLSLGPKMEEFEARVSTYIGAPYGIAVNSGTSGLHLCIRALGIGPGDEVLVPSFTFVAAANAIRYEGAVPVFVDIELRTLNLDPTRLEEAITSRTRAIVVVHTFGVPADMQSILQIARKHHLRVIEDACEALGAEYQGTRVGAFGDLAVFAFYPNKQITTGEGGMIVTQDPRLAADIRAMRNQGRYVSDAWEQHSVLGWNYRLSEINCALGCAQMRRIDEILASRRNVAESYNRSLSTLRGVKVPVLSYEDRSTSWFVYVIQLDPTFARDERDRLMQHLLHQGIGCGRYFAPIHAQPAYSGVSVLHSLPNTDFVSQRTIALPFFNRLADESVFEVTEALEEGLSLL
ncbi:DegT/DnrJ/EryC1/StrS family aminotransferase [Granulicella arctica]|uniref:DegT/DnrJ/EryC1/StrS family aminotransferase n=1 Tax=Granulicella arctica TaxID=940613 RepID=UPI0021DF6EBC|nr:DegT/DnrJ/EryC1/StrS family aminotransferase [Granulicella arctica]